MMRCIIRDGRGRCRGHGGICDRHRKFFDRHFRKANKKRFVNIKKLLNIAGNGLLADDIRNRAAVRVLAIMITSMKDVLISTKKLMLTFSEKVNEFSSHGMSGPLRLAQDISGDCIHRHFQQSGSCKICDNRRRIILESNVLPLCVLKIIKQYCEDPWN